MKIKNLYCIIGESGSGKSTIADKLEEMYNLKTIQSYTTRQPRCENEKGHIFVSKKQFDSLTDKIAYTKFNDNEYCATAEQIENGHLYVIDPKGLAQLKKNYNGSKKIFTIYIKCKLADRYERMRTRGNTCDESIMRILNDIDEFRGYDKYCDFVIQNNNSDKIECVVEKIWEFLKTKE